MKRALVFAQSFLLILIGGSVAIAQGALPGTITFIHEDTGSGDATRLITNLRRLDPRNPGQQTVLTRAMQPGTLLGKPVWSKDYRQLAFSGNFNGVFSLESQSIFAIDPDGSNLRQITGFGVLGQLPGPTGTVTGRVAAPQGGAGAISVCFISAQGSTQSTGCRDDGSFVLENVPVGSTWVRAQASVNYRDATPTGGPGLSVGFAKIAVSAGQVTNAGTIVLNPQLSKSIEPSWSRDGTQVIMTNEVSSSVLRPNSQNTGIEWRTLITQSLAIWGANGTYVRNVSLPNQPDFQLIGADWSPVQDIIACGAAGSGFGQSFVGIINPDGSGARGIYQVSTNVFGPLQLITQCRWSPDGRRIAFIQLSRTPDLSAAWSDLFVINADGSGLRQLTFNRANQLIGTPSWSPDGQFLAFDVQVSLDGSAIQRSDLFALSASGTGLVQLTNDGRSFHPAWGR